MPRMPAVQTLEEGLACTENVAADALASQLESLTIDSGSSSYNKKKRSQRGNRKKLVGSRAVSGQLTALDGTLLPASHKPRFLVRPKDWSSMPDWIILSDKRGKTVGSNHFPPLRHDPLFHDGEPALMPFHPPAGHPPGKGAAIVCPGGNFEFLHPREGEPVARWIAEEFNVPAFVLRYRLLPAHGLDAMQADFHAAVREARRHADGGPVVAFGFSAGGYLCASGAAAATAASLMDATPDALALIYPCTCPDGWLIEEECGFWRAEVTSPQVCSLARGKERLAAGAAFVRPPALFMCASADDDVCPPETETDPFVAAARDAGTASIKYVKGRFGDHGFGLKRFWATPCAAWMRTLGMGCSEQAAVRDEDTPAAQVAATIAGHKESPPPATDEREESTSDANSATTPPPPLSTPPSQLPPQPIASTSSGSRPPDSLLPPHKTKPSAREAKERRDNMRRKICDREWRFLSEDERANALQLGFSGERGWNCDDEEGWRKTSPWLSMSTTEREAAVALQFDENSWWGPPPWEE